MDWSMLFDRGVPLGILVTLVVGVILIREDNKTIKNSLNDLNKRAADSEVAAEKRLNSLFQFLATLFGNDKKRQSGGR